VVAVIVVTTLLGMVTSCALQYLLVERVMRPVVGRALADGPPPGARTPGVAARLTTAWTVATAVPLVGAVAVAVVEIAGADIGKNTVLAAILFLLALALSVGLLATLVSAGAGGGPVAAVARALERVEAGELDTRVPVDDGSEVGLLEAGFNRMAAGLEERERIRDLFGRQVGRDVARAALDGDVTLGGELREVAALFVDLVGSTALAARRPPAEVVALLNDFFAVVVRVAERHDGWVNKFEGDAALCVFGAPTELADPAGAALAAARELRSELDDELDELDAGIGVAAGEAVAGNVGAEHRYEYTVIGDPVNEAARLCDLSKAQRGRLLASDAAVGRAAPEEAERWRVGEPVVLRGRSQETRPATVID
jgi:adenylate cyclase